MRKTGLPVVYLANDYSKDEEPELNVSAFEECKGDKTKRIKVE